MKSMDISIKKEASVHETIGYGLFEYVNHGGRPRISSHFQDTGLWCIRIVEDDGSIDDDFPGKITTPLFRVGF